MGAFSPALLWQNLIFLFHAVSVYFSFISAYILRLQGDGGSSLNKSSKEIDFLQTEILDSSEHKGDELGFSHGGVAAAEEEEEPEVFLKFKFPTYDEFSHVQRETAGVINPEVVPCATVLKYKFTSGQSSVSAFIDVAETFPVKVGCSFGSEEAPSSAAAVNLEEEFYRIQRVQNKGKAIAVSDAEEGEKIEEESDGVVQESRFDFERSSVILVSDSGSDSESSSFDHEATMRHMDSYSDGFLSDGDFGGEFDHDVDDDSGVSGFEENDEFEDEDSDIIEELRTLEEDNAEPHEELKPVLDENLCTTKEGGLVALVTDEGDDDSESKDSSSDDPNKLEPLWEHQELIEQLKMELKKVKATGLPTILEDSESPKITDDLKPWRIDEFQRDDCIGELHKFYKSYRERMRKFDIINYQKMYAMGFLQLKEPLQSISKQKRPPTLKSIVSQNLWLSKHKIHGSDPMKKFVKELEGDLEAVYVGQMCLSWEFLHWQYEKAWDLWDSDPRRRLRYNEVSNEFQQFQVLINRFVEDELFQGPRVQNYVKMRCALRNLLQVPVIREDNMKDKRKEEKGGMQEYAITTDILVEIVEESIRTFWKFVRADKDCSTASTSGTKKIPELPSHEDHKLVMEIKKDLHKKERKLKELLRSENCILRKLRRHKEDEELEQVLCFFSQVDMKLVARVLNMSKVTREQLIWCHNKLDTISFVNRRKIQVEHAFLLFPC